MIESPCTRKCKLNAAKTLCEGCHRTLGEVKGWLESSDKDKRKILELCEERQKWEIAKKEVDSPSSHTR